MKIQSVYINTENGKRIIRDAVTVNRKGALTAVSVNIKSDAPLDKMCAVEILVDLGGVSEFTAVCRHSEYWCKPVFCKSVSEIPENTQCLLWKGGCILPICDGGYISMISGTDSGYIKITLNSFCSEISECRATSFVIGEGEHAEALIKDCVRYAMELKDSPVPLREERTYPEIFEYLGFCSWDAFMTDVSEEKLISKCEELVKKEIPVKWLIIDDMWADTPGIEAGSGLKLKDRLKIMRSCALNSFKADPKRFPNGLSGCIEKLHKLGFKTGMWHPTTGYWHGITQNGEIAQAMPQKLIKAKKYTARTGEYSDDEYLIHAPDFESAKCFYDGFHEYLSECGADFIKVDNQSFTHMYYHDVMPVGTVAQNINRAIDESAQKYFGGAIINCMGTSQENMWSRPSSCISRCSDDFQPENRDWFTKHILQCAFNSLVQGVFHVCDWDMWWTDDSQAVKNSVLRAVSGGPIYVSDTLNRSRKDILMPLCLNDGRILRCESPAVPTEKCLYDDPEYSGKPFILKNTAAGRGYAAVFNLSRDESPVKGSFCAADIFNCDADELVIYEYFTKSAGFIKKDEAVDITLENRDDFRLYTFAPKNDVTFIGLENKMISAKTLMNETADSAVICEDGTTVFISEKDISAVLSNGKEVPFEKDGIIYKVAAEKGTVCVKY